MVKLALIGILGVVVGVGAMAFLTAGEETPPVEAPESTFSEEEIDPLTGLPYVPAEAPADPAAAPAEAPADPAAAPRQQARRIPSAEDLRDSAGNIPMAWSQMQGMARRAYFVVTSDTMYYYAGTIVRPSANAGWSDSNRTANCLPARIVYGYGESLVSGWFGPNDETYHGCLPMAHLAYLGPTWNSDWMSASEMWNATLSRAVGDYLCQEATGNCTPRWPATTP